ncbi:hypothetical protein CC85DRAFT_283720 [Cutaneotrichosporon oleaginosum]|uniref:Uncharacterized protein n=1 Tax=Cutaneotrichosporon oleaginosum TaxID=879819 RepID=A0A0J0XSZ9_9TREE|nr:uncharacterized protein CC85DRAFT_283720 [Cutaneotrichosporon oleaginosum]KLT44202.1 hypothetical protein CC85DRAFT_283720 [Cutaneotrichosporon oleaginosum]TXT11629.1 hypothetical protein COLE_02039 [Cutaneotrichosporon oleaginosum]
MPFAPLTLSFSPPSTPPSLRASSVYSQSSGDSIFPPEVWGTRATAPPAPPMIPMSSKMAERLRAVAEHEMSPALPESPEVIMLAQRPLPHVPTSGTRPGPALGLALGQPALPLTMPSGLLTPPPTEHADSPKSWTTHSTHADSPMSWTQDFRPIQAGPLPPLPSTLPQTRPRSLGRKLPPTLTESLELLVRVQEHCHKLGASSNLRAVPEEVSTPSPRDKRGSLPPARVARRATEPSFSSCVNLHAVPEHMEARPPRRLTAPAPLQRTHSASSASSSSGDWPETPRTSTYTSNATESVHSSTYREDVRPQRQAMRSVVALDKYPVSAATLAYAAELEVFDETGVPLRFGDLLAAPRTLVVFVRHWLSPSCATYLRELIAALTPPLLARACARVVFIGHGAANMIRGFRQHLQCPFMVYTDPTRRLHDVLGLVPKGSKGFHLSKAKELFLGAARIGLRSGNRAQMGGLFIFEGHDIAFVHRMRADSDHAPVPIVLDAIGRRPPPPPPNAHAPHRPKRSSVYVQRPGGTHKPRGAHSCTSLVDPPPRFVFPLPPSSQTRRDSHKRMTSASRDCVAVIHPDDIDRISSEVHALRV